MNAVVRLAALSLTLSLLAGCVCIRPQAPIPVPPVPMPPPAPIDSQIALPVRTAAPDLNVINANVCEHSNGQQSGTIFTSGLFVTYGVRFEYWRGPIAAALAGNTV